MTTLRAQESETRSVIQSALGLVADLPSLSHAPRTYVAEMIVVRVFALFEAVVEDVACRLVCGAPYSDGSMPTLNRTRPTSGLERARQAMRTFGRADPHNKLRWNKASEIRRNLEHLFPSNEHFVLSLTGHGQFISDLRKVRNHIAHNNAGTRKRFHEVVRNEYGASINGMTPGRMLLSSRFTPSIVERYCRQTRIILLDAMKA